MRISAEDRLVQLKPKFTPEKPKVSVRPKHKSSDCSSEEIEDDHFCSKEAAKKINLKTVPGASVLKSHYKTRNSLLSPGLETKTRILLEKIEWKKIFFIANCVLVFGASVLFVCLVAQKWSYSPTIISINPVPSYVTGYPFPAVTICNMNQALRSKVSKFSKSSMEYSFVKFLCRSDPNITVLNAIKDWSFISNFAVNTSQSCERMLLKCNFGGVEYNCTELFHPVILDEGLCCTFNSLDQVDKFTNISTKFNYSKTYPPNVKPGDWSLENGYQNPLPKYYSPMTAVGSGQTLGLNIILNVEKDEYYCSSGNSVGFKVALDNPEEEPNMSESALLLAPGLKSSIRIIPTHEEADRKLRILSRNGSYQYFRIIHT
ncbi:pickpocket protein 28-like [Bactrocera tryoni]|uniref:pickpocket protein 28-like n=1 Tax=Bactrocera tryoni TaxID=59916 RepID=UPI001A9821F0|nr:pickpocket protein 28-like [Bactrocera tryoni]